MRSAACRRSRCHHRRRRRRCRSANPSHSARPGSLKCTWGSTTPGKTWRPVASISVAASPASSAPTSAIRPSRIPMSARVTLSGPTTRAPRTRTSKVPIAGERLSSARWRDSNGDSRSLAGTSPPTPSSVAAACSACSPASGSTRTSRSSTASIAGVGEYDGAEVIDATGRYVVPGFIDAHMHLESVKLLVDEFARLVLPLGTTAVVADPHEIANVLGTDGVHWLLDASADLQLDVFFMAPSCVPASPFESPRRAARARRPRVADAAQPRARAGRDDELPRRRRRLARRSSRSSRSQGAEHVDGHAPGPHRQGAAGVRGVGHPLRPRVPDRRRGSRAAPRRHVAPDPRGVDGTQPEGAAAARASSTGRAGSRSAPTTATPRTSPTNGHINGMVREAVALGIPPEDAIVMASFNPAQWHRLHDLGAVAPGYQADLLLLPDLEQLRSRPRAEATAARSRTWRRRPCRTGCARPCG